MARDRQKISYRPKVLGRKHLIRTFPIPVRVDKIMLRPGRVGEYTILEYHAAAACIAFADHQKVVLVRVPRYPIGKYLWELPGGKINRGESPVGCARRELEEETGYRAHFVKRMLTFYPEPSFSIEQFHIFLATKLTRDGIVKSEREGFAEVGLFGIREAFRMIFESTIASSWSVIGILIAYQRLGFLERPLDC